MDPSQHATAQVYTLHVIHSYRISSVAHPEVSHLQCAA